MAFRLVKSYTGICPSASHTTVRHTVSSVCASVGLQALSDLSPLSRTVRVRPIFIIFFCIIGAWRTPASVSACWVVLSILLSYVYCCNIALGKQSRAVHTIMHRSSLLRPVHDVNDVRRQYYFYWVQNECSVNGPLLYNLWLAIGPSRPTRLSWYTQLSLRKVDACWCWDTLGFLGFKGFKKVFRVLSYIFDIYYGADSTLKIQLLNINYN